jgi:SAM-dependent methyltransferase
MLSKNMAVSRLAVEWYSNYDIGKIKELYFRYLQNRYQFDMWHITPINFRPYAIDIVRYLNRNNVGSVVEIGCGLGEIIGNISCRGERLGFDIDKNVVKAAKKVYHKTSFQVGSFEKVNNKKVDYLITVNFIHGIAPENLKKSYKEICCNNEIQHIVLDIVDSHRYAFCHDINFLFDGSEYKVKKRLHRYETVGGSRWIYIMEKIMD